MSFFRRKTTTAQLRRRVRRVPGAFWVVDQFGWAVDVAPSQRDAQRVADAVTAKTRRAHFLVPVTSLV